ncbi:MAG: 1-acyl-sn-glycerol-3-phosphate acyltransferase [Brachyspira sp.]|nr:1-acyl-sn-glycerol-3-phosphate acyltransferase [Brachyspira sp.]
MVKKKKEYTKRTSSQYNLWRGIFQNLVCKFGYMIRFKLVYRLEVHGLENVPKDNEYIVCPNHLSTLDPPLMVSIMPRHVAFMAKKELFDIPFLRWWIDWLGAFAVNRESLGPSTIKTVMEIKKSKWVFGIFPQGTRGVTGEIRGVTKGFAGLAKITKCAILPVGIIGTDEVKRLPFSGKIIVNIGKPIPYSNDVDSVVEKWTEEIQKLTGFTYIKDENKAENSEIQQN